MRRGTASCSGWSVWADAATSLSARFRRVWGSGSKYALALVHRPVVLALDEPTANLDASGSAVVRSIAERHRARGGLLIVATNEADELSWGNLRVNVGGEG